jgi:hypothetical protein
VQAQTDGGRCRSQGDYFEGDGSQNWVKLSQHFFFDLVRELSDTSRTNTSTATIHQ